jgi:hypothetical protein
VVLQEILKMMRILHIDQFSIVRQIHVMQARLPVYSPTKNTDVIKIINGLLMTGMLDNANVVINKIISRTIHNSGAFMNSPQPFFSYPTVTGT